MKVARIRPCVWQVLEKWKLQREMRNIYRTYAVLSTALILCLSFLVSFGPAVTTLHHIPRESPELALWDVVSFV